MTPGRLGETQVHLVPWGPGDLPLLERLLGDPRMMTHLGGPESPETIRARQTRYEAIEEVGDASKARTLKIVDSISVEGIGWVGYWQSNWRDAAVYEMGWSVLPSFQGRGVASAAASQALELARSAAQQRYMFAFPAFDNFASNAICRKLGFELLGECQYEYPPGKLMRGNEWRMELLRG